MNLPLTAQQIMTSTLSYWFNFRDSWGRLHCEIVAIDALVIRCYPDQFLNHMVRRELNKVNMIHELRVLAIHQVQKQLHIYMYTETSANILHFPISML